MANSRTQPPSLLMQETCRKSSSQHQSESSRPGDVDESAKSEVPRPAAVAHRGVRLFVVHIGLFEFCRPSVVEQAEDNLYPSCKSSFPSGGNADGSR